LINFLYLFVTQTYYFIRENGKWKDENSKTVGMVLYAIKFFDIYQKNKINYGFIPLQTITWQ